MNNFGYIYKTTNRINKKVYIGQSKGEFKPNYFGSGIHIIRAVRKNGVEGFEVKILAKASSKKKLDVLEIKYIKEYKKLFPKKTYNISEGGTGASWGEANVAKQPKVRRKIKQAALKQFSNPEMRKYLSEIAKKRVGKLNPMYGKHHKEDSKKKIGKANTRRIRHDLRGVSKPLEQIKNMKKAWIARRKRGVSKETRLKMSIAHRGVPLSEEHKQRMRHPHRVKQGV